MSEPSKAALEFIQARVGCAERCAEIICDCFFVAKACDDFAAQVAAERAQPASGEQIIKRRFGPAFDKPCVRPDVIECAMWECQFKDECQYADKTAAERAMPAASDRGKAAQVIEEWMTKTSVQGWAVEEFHGLDRCFAAALAEARQAGEIAMRERCRQAVMVWPGLTEGEKRVVLILLDRMEGKGNEWIHDSRKRYRK